jgi:AmiR/NasT family two-component response regulator
MSELRACHERITSNVRYSVERRNDREVLHHSAYARLQARLETQPVIDQAKGILIARKGCSPDEAFDILRRASQRSNVPVRELAAQIVKNNMSKSRPSERHPAASSAPELWVA